MKESGVTDPSRVPGGAVPPGDGRCCRVNLYKSEGRWEAEVDHVKGRPDRIRFEFINNADTAVLLWFENPRVVGGFRALVVPLEERGKEARDASGDMPTVPGETTNFSCQDWPDTYTDPPGVPYIRDTLP